MLDFVLPFRLVCIPVFESLKRGVESVGTVVCNKSHRDYSNRSSNSLIRIEKLEGVNLKKTI